MNRLIGGKRSEVAPVVREIVYELAVGIEVELPLLRLIADKVAIKLNLAAFSL